MTAPAFDAALAYAEERIQALVASLDRPIDGFLQPSALTVGMARQAGSIHLDLMALAAAGRTVAATILLRPLVEAAILVRWIELDPQPHTDMYFAEDDRLRLASAPAIAEFRKRRGISRPGPVFDPAVEAQMKATIAATKASAIAAGEITGKSNRLLPLIPDMVAATGDTAIWEAYQIIYRVVSPWTHFGGRAMAQHELETRPDGKYLVPRAGFGRVAIRAVTAPTMLVLLGSVSRIAALGFEGEARVLQDTIALWPSEALADVAP